MQSVRFLNLDGDGANTDFRSDMLCLSDAGDWLLVSDDSPDVVATLNARAGGIESLAIGNFKTVGDDAPGANPARDDVLYFGGSPIEHLF